MIGSLGTTALGRNPPMQHLYRTAEDLQAKQPVCAGSEPSHPIKPEPVCARCHSVMAHWLQDQIASLRDQIRHQDAEIYRLRTADKPRL